MKLPDPSQLISEEHRFLYKHDREELHCLKPKNFSSYLYQDRFEETISAIKKLHVKNPSELTVLDIGCAQGNFSLKLAELGFKVIALDLRFQFLSYSRMKWETGDLRWVNASLENLPFLPGAFDIVLATEVIEHVAFPDKLLRNLKTICKPSGFILITTPNGSRLGTKLPTLSGIANRVDLESKQFLPDSDGHLFLMTRKELYEEGKKAGLNMIQHRYISSFWVTGGMKMPFLLNTIPQFLRCLCNAALLKIPFLASLFSEGHLAVFKPSQSQ